MARQGQSFATALDVRVVYPLPEDLPSDADPELVDVPWDGKTVGEIVTRGNIVMKEVGFALHDSQSYYVRLTPNKQYFRDPEATSKAFRGGHFHSGDLAVMDPDGTVKIIDRSKDLIISGGEVRLFLAILLFQGPTLTCGLEECIERGD
jgi:acyl-CoA synthetase (AMP-forming)/AMP-acid ligase II